MLQSGYSTFCNNNFMEHILSAYVMENIDTTNGLERFPELM